MSSSFKNCKAFTLIELAIVLLIMAGVFALVGGDVGTSTRLKEEGFIRNFRNTISFLYNQAISDQTQYVLNINLKEDNEFEYNVGVRHSSQNNTISSIDPTPTLNRIGEAFKNRSVSEALGSNSSNTLTNGDTFGLSSAGNIREEFLARSYPEEKESDVRKNSKFGPRGDYKAKGFYGKREDRDEWEAERNEEEGGIQEAPNFPSLYRMQEAPPFLKIKDIIIFEEKYTPNDVDNVQILFDAQGFTDFVVIHFYNDYTGKEKEYTLLINPFTGITELYNEYKDFEWTFNDKD